MPLPVRRRAALLLLPLGIGAAVALSPSADAATTGFTTRAAARPTIRISGFAFAVPSSVKRGAHITVVNRDTVDHTVTSTVRGHRFDLVVRAHRSAVLVAPSKKGVVAFHCTYHPSMHGRLAVR